MYANFVVKNILYNTHINIDINGLEKAVYSTQAN